MNRNDFLNMIGNTVVVDRQMIREVNELIEVFPYFQSAHLLLLKGMYTNEDVKFENQLRTSAIHLGDREVLYWLLNRRDSSEKQKAGLKEQNNSIKEITSDTQQTVIESARNSESMINEIEKNSDETENRKNRNLSTGIRLIQC
jgi:single-stranded DNA-specific DHH superfamily exonuclease